MRNTTLFILFLLLAAACSRVPSADWTEGPAEPDGRALHTLVLHDVPEGSRVWFQELFDGKTSVEGPTMNHYQGTSWYIDIPESGTVTVTATDGIQISLDKQTWSSSLSIDYNASTLVKTVHAQALLEKSGDMNGTITVKQGDKTLDVPVTATAVTLDGGTEVKAYWRLEKDDTYELTGPATVIAESWEGMYVQRYANPNANTTWPEWTGFEASRKTQRNLLTGDTWPAEEIDDNPTRYIQWGIKPALGTELKIDEISLFVCGCGGNGMCSHIYFSTDNFETRTTIFEMKKMPANNMQYVKTTPVISLQEGQELLVRVYPWYNGAASGKTICLSDLTIHGMAVDAGATGIKEVSGSGNKSSDVQYYSLDGMLLSSPKAGLNIMHMADGSVKKVIY